MRDLPPQRSNLCQKSGHVKKIYDAASAATRRELLQREERQCELVPTETAKLYEAALLEEGESGVGRAGRRADTAAGRTERSQRGAD